MRKRVRSQSSLALSSTTPLTFFAGPLRRSGGHTIGRSSSELSLPPSSVIGNQRLYDRKSSCASPCATRARPRRSEWPATSSQPMACVGIAAYPLAGAWHERALRRAIHGPGYRVPRRSSPGPAAPPSHFTHLVACGNVPDPLRDLKAIGLDVGHRDCFTWRRRGGVLPRHFHLICHCSAACGLPNSQVRATGAARDCPRCQWAGGQAHMTRSASTPSATTPLRGA